MASPSGRNWPAIRARATLPVVVITGSQLPLDGVDAACVLRKPFTMDELLAAIQSCLRTSGA